MRTATVLFAIMGVAQAMVAVPRDGYGKVDDYKPDYKPATTDKKPYPPKETKDCDDDDDKPYPHKYPTKGHDDDYPTKKGPKPTKGPYKHKTSTYTVTHTYTITKCDDYVKDCPYNDKYPHTTTTEEVYTTVCPEEDYPTKAPEYPTSSYAPDYPTYAPEYPTSSYAPKYPTSSYAPDYPTYAPEYPASGSSPKYPTTSKAPYVVAGAGRVEGGLLAAVAGVAAMLL